MATMAVLLVLSIVAIFRLALYLPHSDNKKVQVIKLCHLLVGVVDCAVENLDEGVDRLKVLDGSLE